MTDLPSTLLWNQGNDMYHIIDPRGATTLCGFYSAWGTRRPDHGPGRSVGGSAGLEFVNTEYRDVPESKVCKRCLKRHNADELCPECNAIMGEKYEYDSGRTGRILKWCDACETEHGYVDFEIVEK